MIWQDESCWKDGWSFELCCRNGRDVKRLERILEGGQRVKGNAACWEGAKFQNDLCCPLNRNLDKVPNFNHVIWQIRMPDARMVNVVQGQVLEAWERKKIIGPGRFPHMDLMHNGEGLVWGAGAAAVAFALAEFPHGRRPLRFLEVASSVGAPSLVALAKGFHVWSSEVRRENAWQRLAGARSSFGRGSPEERRLRVPILDLFNPSTWPTGLFFDVILLGGPCWSATPTPEEEATFCGNFQKLADVHLATGGTALLFFKPELLRRRGGNISETEASHCLRRDGPFLIAMHQAMNDGSWRTRWLQQDLLDDFESVARLPLVFSLQRRNETR